MLIHRAEQAGYEDVTPHQFRHKDGAPGVARAWLSDGYKPIGHLDTLTAVFAGIRAARADNPVVFAGFVVANSETGCGACTVTPRLVAQVCSNEMTDTRDAVRALHLGDAARTVEVISADTVARTGRPLTRFRMITAEVTEDWHGLPIGRVDTDSTLIRVSQDPNGTGILIQALTSEPAEASALAITVDGKLVSRPPDLDGAEPGGKRPALRGNWQELATTDPCMVRRWWRRAPCNIGIACGPSGLVVLDLDVARQPHMDGAAGSGGGVLAALCERHGRSYPLPTYVVGTPSGAATCITQPLARGCETRPGGSAL